MAEKRNPEPLITPENFLSEKIVRGLRKRHGDKHEKTRKPDKYSSPGPVAENAGG